eukprot:5686911-Pleurochrysis_carterae.AAC.1
MAMAARLQLPAPPTLAPHSICAKLSKAGATPGAVQTFNYLYSLQMPNARAKGALPCAWRALFGACDKQATGECDNC